MEANILTLTKNAENAKNNETRINENIRAAEVRVIDSNGNNAGVMPLSDAQRMADDENLDLVEISPNENPPICKVIDYGKWKYERQKSEAEQRKNRNVISTKELKFRPVIDKNDYDVKVRNAIKFLKDGDKVRFTMRFRGREITHKEIGEGVFKRLLEDLSAYGKVESPPRIDGQQMSMTIRATK